MTALIIGATGLTGSHLLQLLLADLRFERVLVFVRRSTGIIHPKLEEHIVCFDRPEEWKDLVRGDVLFSCLGTTLRVAGSKEAQYKVDFTYQYAFASAAASGGVPTYVLISSSGANAKALFFYLRMKGALEDAILALPFQRIRILEPGPIAGERTVERPMEKFSLRLIRLLNAAGMARQYHPISAEELARALRNAALRPAEGVEVFRMAAVFDLAQN